MTSLSGPEAVSLLLGNAQRYGLVRTDELLENLVQDVKETATGDHVQLRELLETCLHVYVKCDASQDDASDAKLRKAAQSLFESCCEILASCARCDKTGDQQVALQNTVMKVLTHVRKRVSCDQLVITCLKSVRAHTQDKKFTYGAGPSQDESPAEGSQSRTQESGEPHSRLENGHQGVLGVHVALQALRHVLPTSSAPNSDLSGDLDIKVSTVLSKSLHHVDDQVCGKVLTTIFPLMLQNSSEGTRKVILEQLWSVIQEIHEKFGQKSFRTKNVHPLSERPLLLLCGLADWLFPVCDVTEGQDDVMLTRASFWGMLQAGFFHYNPLTRKRAQYLIKRILDTVEQQGKTLMPVFAAAFFLRLTFRNLWHGGDTVRLQGWFGINVKEKTKGVTRAERPDVSNRDQNWQHTYR